MRKFLLLSLLLTVSPVVAQDTLQDARKRLDELLSPKQADLFIEHPAAPEPPPAPQPAISFQKQMKTLTTSAPPQKVVVHWLVSESWCPSCPAAKAKFLAEGHPASNILTIAQARSRHGIITKYVPYRYTTTETRQLTGSASSTAYRSEWPPKWHVEGNHYPSRSELLEHLRNNPNHAGKHWQDWPLESWSQEQLAALHSDDHDGRIGSYSPPVSSTASKEILDLLTVYAEGISPSPYTVLGVLSDSLVESHIETHPEASEGLSEPSYGGWFDVNVKTPDFLPGLLEQLFTSQKYTNDSMGLYLDWSGDRLFTLTSTGVQLKPAVKVTVQKYGVKVSASVSEIQFSNSFRTVKVITPELLVPDIQINFN